MHKKLNKKAEGMWIIVLVVVIILIILWLLLGYAIRQCSYDSQCPADNYCGSDFKCHQYKVVERNLVVTDYSTPAAIVAIAIIIGAIIIRADIFNSIKKKLMPKSFIYAHGHEKHQCDYNCAEHPMYPQYKGMHWVKK